MFVFVAILVLSLASLAEPVGVRPRYSTSWAVEVDGGEREAERLAFTHGLINRGTVRSSANNEFRRHKSLPDVARWGV